MDFETINNIVNFVGGLTLIGFCLLPGLIIITDTIIEERKEKNGTKNYDN